MIAATAGKVGRDGQHGSQRSSFTRLDTEHGVVSTNDAAGVKICGNPIALITLVAPTGMVQVARRLSRHRNIPRSVVLLHAASSNIFIVADARPCRFATNPM